MKSYTTAIERFYLYSRDAIGLTRNHHRIEKKGKAKILLTVVTQSRINPWLECILSWPWIFDFMKMYTQKYEQHTHTRDREINMKILSIHENAEHGIGLKDQINIEIRPRILNFMTTVFFLAVCLPYGKFMNAFHLYNDDFGDITHNFVLCCALRIPFSICCILHILLLLLLLCTPYFLF